VGRELPICGKAKIPAVLDTLHRPGTKRDTGNDGVTIKWSAKRGFYGISGILAEFVF
jgi:hypothetical protein